MVPKIDKIIKSKRKSYTLIIGDNAELIVKAPLYARKEKIDNLVLSKKDWILEKQQEIRTQLAAYPKHKFVKGERFLVLGFYYLLDFQPVKKCCISENKLVVPDKLKKDAKSAVVKWYKSKAKKFLFEKADYFSAITGFTFSFEKADYFSAITGFTFSKLSLSGATSRWGSCSSKNSINLNFKLLMCPEKIIDYVVVHELCHIKHKNHKKEFWNEVANIIPDFQERRNWLKNNRMILSDL